MGPPSHTSLPAVLGLAFFLPRAVATLLRREVEVPLTPPFPTGSEPLVLALAARRLPRTSSRLGDEAGMSPDVARAWVDVLPVARLLRPTSWSSFRDAVPFELTRTGRRWIETTVESLRRGELPV